MAASVQTFGRPCAPLRTLSSQRMSGDIQTVRLPRFCRLRLYSGQLLVP